MSEATTAIETELNALRRTVQRLEVASGSNWQTPAATKVEFDKLVSQVEKLAAHVGTTADAAKYAQIAADNAQRCADHAITSLHPNLVAALEPVIEAHAESADKLRGEIRSSAGAAAAEARAAREVAAAAATDARDVLTASAYSLSEVETPEVVARVTLRAKNILTGVDGEFMALEMPAGRPPRDASVGALLARMPAKSVSVSTISTAIRTIRKAAAARVALLAEGLDDAQRKSDALLAIADYLDGNAESLPGSTPTILAAAARACKRGVTLALWPSPGAQLRRDATAALSELEQGRRKLRQLEDALQIACAKNAAQALERFAKSTPSGIKAAVATKAAKSYRDTAARASISYASNYSKRTNVQRLADELGFHLTK